MKTLMVLVFTFLLLIPNVSFPFDSSEQLLLALTERLGNSAQQKQYNKAARTDMLMGLLMLFQLFQLILKNINPCFVFHRRTVSH